MPETTELESLRDEILQLSGRRLNATTFAITVTVGIIGFGLQSQSHKSLIMLIPLIILFFAGIQMASLYHSTVRIATYIRKFIEPKNENLHWETFMHAYRTHVAEYPKLSRLSWPAYQIVLVGVGWICVILSFVFAVEEVSAVSTPGFYLSFIAPISGAILWLIFSIWFLRSMKLVVSGVLDAEFERMWSNLAEEVNKRKAGE